MRATFPKNERLCSKIIIKQLLASQQKILNYPFLLKWTYVDLKSTAPVQILIAVPKRKIKKAVHRNYIKRIIRESYRKNKHIIHIPLKEKNQKMVLSITFLGHKNVDYKETEMKISSLMQQLLSSFQS